MEWPSGDGWVGRLGGDGPSPIVQIAHAEICGRETSAGEAGEGEILGFGGRILGLGLYKGFYAIYVT